MTERRSPNPRGASSPVRRPPRKRPRILIQVDPADADEELSLTEKLIKEAKHGVPGLGVSLAVHAIILLVMYLVVVGGVKAEKLIMEGYWTPLDTKKGAPTGEVGDDEAARIQAIAINSQTGNVKQPDFVPKENNDQNQVGEGKKINVASVQGLLDGRNQRRREALRDELGGNAKAEAAVTMGLGWLVRNQQEAGNWSLHEGYPDPGYRHLRTDTGATALALLAFLGDGHTHVGGKYPEVVQKGLDWLLGIQQENGDFHDFSERGRQTAFYAHSQATIVVCEAYAMTGDDNLKEPAERAIRYLIQSQQPNKGGWKYQPQDTESHGDLSVTGWALMALHTARAAGISVPDGVFVLSSQFLDSVQVEDGSLYKYEETDSADRVSPALTAEGLLCRQFLGWPKDHPAMIEGINYLRKPAYRPKWEIGKRNVYHWYYATHVFHNYGEDLWKDWYNLVAEQLVNHQLSAGSREIRGSWSPHLKFNRRTGETEYGDQHEYAQFGGRLYITCMCILTLEAPYRHQPIYK